MIFNLVTSASCRPDGYSNETQTYSSFLSEYSSFLSGNITVDTYTFFDKSIENTDFNICDITKKIIVELESNGYNVENKGGESILYLIGNDANNSDIDSLSIFYDGTFLLISFRLKYQEIYIDISKEPTFIVVLSNLQNQSDNLIAKLISIINDEYSKNGKILVSPYTKKIIYGNNLFLKKRNPISYEDIYIFPYPDLDRYENEKKTIENLLEKYDEDYPLDRIKYKEGAYKDIQYKCAYLDRGYLQYDYDLILISSVNKGKSIPFLYNEKSYEMSDFWKEYESLIEQHNSLSSIENYYNSITDVSDKLYSEEESKNYGFIIQYGNSINKLTEQENEYRDLFNLFFMENQFPDISMVKEDIVKIQKIKEIRLEAEKIRARTEKELTESENIPEEKKVPFYKNNIVVQWIGIAFATIIGIILIYLTIKQFRS